MVGFVNNLGRFGLNAVDSVLTNRLGLGGIYATKQASQEIATLAADNVQRLAFSKIYDPNPVAVANATAEKVQSLLPRYGLTVKDYNAGLTLSALEQSASQSGNLPKAGLAGFIEDVASRPSIQDAEGRFFDWINRTVVSPRIKKNVERYLLPGETFGRLNAERRAEVTQQVLNDFDLPPFLRRIVDVGKIRATQKAQFNLIKSRVDGKTTIEQQLAEQAIGQNGTVSKLSEQLKTAIRKGESRADIAKIQQELDKVEAVSGLDPIRQLLVRRQDIASQVGQGRQGRSSFFGPQETKLETGYQKYLSEQAVQQQVERIRNIYTLADDSPIVTASQRVEAVTQNAVDGLKQKFQPQPKQKIQTAVQTAVDGLNSTLYNTALAREVMDGNLSPDQYAVAANLKTLTNDVNLPYILKSGKKLDTSLSPATDASLDSLRNKTAKEIEQKKDSQFRVFMSSGHKLIKPDRILPDAVREKVVQLGESNLRSQHTNNFFRQLDYNPNRLNARRTSETIVKRYYKLVNEGHILPATHLESSFLPRGQYTVPDRAEAAFREEFTHVAKTGDFPGNSPENLLAMYGSETLEKLAKQSEAFKGVKPLDYASVTPKTPEDFAAQMVLKYYTDNGIFKP